MAQLKDLIVNGPSRFIGDVYATTFTGNLAGNASTATNATNAGMIAGLSIHSGRNNEANKIVRTDGNGYLQVGYINSSSGHEKNASNPTYVWGSNSSDSYLRSYQTSSLSVKYATSSGSCSGNAATATKASYLDTGGMALYANNKNEINFGGTNTSSTIFFGYRATGSRSIPTSFIFGGSGGTATLTAGGFKKKDSSASYVLTGDGGHAAISSLSVNYANSSGSCSGNAATATNASSARDADKLDGYHLSQITPVVTKRDFTNGTLVKTNISFPGTNTNVSEPFLLTVKGNGYGDGIINFEFQGYVYYASNYAHPKIINSDFIIYSPNSIDKIYTMSIDNKLCFWWARQSYWQGFHIFCTTSTQSYQNRVIEVQDVSKPSGLFEQIYTPKLSLTTNNYTSYTVAKTGGGATGTWNISISGNAATATNADTLDGQHNIEQVSDWNSWVGSFRISAENNVTNAPAKGFHYGYQMQFHRQPAVFYTDLITNLYRDELYFRRHDENGYGAWKQIAFLDSNVTSSSKWSTARTITLTGSVTGSVSIDGSQNVTLATTTNHTHNYAGSSSAGGSANSALTLLTNNKFDTTYGNYAIFQTSARISNFPHNGWFNSIKMLHNDSRGYFTEIATSFTGEDGMWRRVLQAGTQVGWYKMLDSGNYNSYAPKLDGTGANGTWGINISGKANIANNLLFIENISANTRGELSGDYRLYTGLWSKKDLGYASQYGQFIDLSGGATWYHRLAFNTTGVIEHFQGINTTTLTKVGDLAYTSSNVASATKLQNSRTIWGQSFDGTGNVSGALTGVTSITASGHTKVNSLKTQYICIECDNNGNSHGRSSEINNYDGPLYLQYNSSRNCAICAGGGNVGIGTTSPSYKLYVNGDGYFVDNVITESDFSSRGNAIIDGTISCYKLSQTSDIKYKTNIKQIEYEEALKIIENLNPVTWDWNENTIVTGSSSGFVAQEAEEFIPNAISRDNKNNLSLDYTQLHSYEIKVIQEQQKEIIKLKEKLKILEKLIS